MAQQPNFWATLPGILTGLAALITAGTGLYLAVRDADPAPEPPGPPTNVPKPVTGGNGGTTPPPVIGGSQPGPGTPPTVTSVAGGAALTPLVDCTQPAFQLPNTVRSLMSWSDYYHEQIPGAGNAAAGACHKALAYRGSAHCQEPQDMAVRQALFETLNLCRAAGVDVTRIPPQ